MLRSSWTTLVGALAVVLPLTLLGSSSEFIDVDWTESTALASIGFVGGGERLHPPSRSKNWIALAAPSRAEWHATFTNVNQVSAGLQREARRGEYSMSALALRFNAPVFDSVGRNRRVIGRIRRGNALAARKPDNRTTCYEGGRHEPWYQTPRGYICGAWHFEVADSRIELASRQRQADVSIPLPFVYARVITDGAPRFTRLPSKNELERGRELDSRSRKLPDFIVERMVGDFFVALDRIEESNGTRFYRTVSGEFVLEEDLEVRTPSEFFGERIKTENQLPMAFVFGDDESPIFCRDGDTAIECGKAYKHVRFAVRGNSEIDGTRYVEMDSGRLIERSHVRIAETTDKPSRVPDGQKWVHINLDRQTLVAYEGERPVYATLVSTGKKAHKTPTGLYRTRRKYISVTMRGKDPVEGIYHVEEVPWTMFYRGGYAIHGAYWHDDFGKTRSHGCTNLSAADARWLYHWESLNVPRSWHAVTGRKGTWLHFTRGKSAG